MTRRERENLLEGLDARFRSPLLAYFARRVRDASEAEDLTQEVFLRLARVHGAVPIDSIQGYVFQTAANLLRDRARRRSTRHAYQATLFNSDDWDVDVLNPARYLEARADLQALEAHLRAMPERMRQAFILYRFEGISKTMIAESLSVSVSTVEKDVALALGILTQKLDRPQ